MNNGLIINLAFHVVGGIGIFLLGMKSMSDGLQTIAGDRLRKLIGMATNNRFLATGVGTLVTCLIQSSTVTTVMTVGFVNSGIMTLKQAIGIIMGANIGTTLTAWMLAVQMGSYGLPMLGLAAFVYLFAKNEKLRYAGMAAMGVGMIFFGLEIMKTGFAPLRDIPEYIEWFHMFSADSYFGVVKCALAGCFLTVVVQSSTATIGITMGLAVSGIIPFETAAALIIGENLGTTLTAYIASLGTTTNGKRAAFAHITFNVIGVLWITAAFSLYMALIRTLIGHDPNTVVVVNGAETLPYIQPAIAAVHSVFNVLNTMLFLPLTPLLALFLTKLIPGKQIREQPKLTKLGKFMLGSPMVGIARSRYEIINMGKHDRDMLNILKTIISGEEENDDKLVEKIFYKEDVMDNMQKEITVFLTGVLSGNVPRSLAEEAQIQLRLADEYETISDYVTTLVKLCKRIRNAGGVELPQIMRDELLSLHNSVSDYFDMVNNAYSVNNRAIISKANPLSDAITHKFRDLRRRHLTRLSEAPVDPLLSTTFPDMLISYRRIKDHVLNIAEVMAGEVA
ncbi:MAG: Na/Pi cotransporter family protein [Chitinispirillales bacterium]|jgi:phosphate:Na+ symporter|nr:Na/Pi cotransporter family protein [Chitinispirillales bacterium]